MPFKLREEDLGFPARAYIKLDYDHVIPAPPEKVFAILADHDAWAKWFVDFKRAVVTSEIREGVGLTRRVYVGPMVLGERFLAWDPGARLGFTMTTTNLPILTAMVEDWRLSPVDGGAKTRLDYTVAFDLPGWLKPLVGLLLWKFRPLFEKALPNLAAYAARA